MNGRVINEGVVWMVITLDKYACHYKVCSTHRIIGKLTASQTFVSEHESSFLDSAVISSGFPRHRVLFWVYRPGRNRHAAPTGFALSSRFLRTLRLDIKMFSVGRRKPTSSWLFFFCPPICPPSELRHLLRQFRRTGATFSCVDRGEDPWDQGARFFTLTFFFCFFCFF